MKSNQHSTSSFPIGSDRSFILRVNTLAMTQTAGKTGSYFTVSFVPHNQHIMYETAQNLKRMLKLSKSQFAHIPRCSIHTYLKKKEFLSYS